MRRHSTIGAGLVLVAATGLAGASPVSAGPGVPTSAVTPTLHARISSHGFKLTGDRSFPSNRVTITLTAIGGERVLQVVKFMHGYTLADEKRDIRYFGSHTNSAGRPSKSALRRLHRLIRNVGLFGGVDAEPHRPSTETVVLPPGKYTLLDDTGALPARPRTIKVTGPAVPAAPAPVSRATVTMKASRERFGGAKTLPAKGTIAVINHSKADPHFLVLQHLKNGTTRKEFGAALRDNKLSGIMRFGTGGTDALRPGRSETISYSLPKGEYGEYCFFPNPKTGIPSYEYGMYRIVSLK